MIRIFLNFIKWIFLSAFGLYFLFVASNWGDEDLKPEVQAILNWHSPATQDDNGYLILLGMSAPFDQDALHVGKAKLAENIARFETARKTQTIPPAQNEVNAFIPYQESAGLQDYLCRYNQAENCIEFYLMHDANTVKQVIASQEVLLARFAALKASNQFTEISVPMSNIDFSGISAYLVAIELEYMQAAQDIAAGKENAGVQRLLDNALHNRTMLKNSVTHGSRALMLSRVEQDVRILSELMAKYPALAKSYKQLFLPLLNPISTSEYNLEAPFINDRADSILMFDFTLDATKALERNAQLSFFDKLKGVNFQPNATLNFLYDLKTLRLKLATMDAQQIDAVKAQVEAEKKSLLGFGYKPYYFKNSIGKILVTTLDVSGLLDDFEAFHDIEGYMRLVRLQLDSLQAGNSKTDLERLLAKYPDPYTNKPMRFDSNKGILVFKGRSDSQVNEYRVAIAPII